MPGATHAKTLSKDIPQFNKDIKDVHLIYDYDAQDSNGNPEKWRYEMWFFSSTRIVYKIHGGPMAGRTNFQTASYQCIRPGELWQCNWLEGILSRSRITFLRPSVVISLEVCLLTVNVNTYILHSTYTIHRNRNDMLPNLRHPQANHHHAPGFQPRTLGKA